jgi:hypothetical protein
MEKRIVEQKRSGRLLLTSDDLYRLFLESEDANPERAGLRAEFDHCIGLVEAQGLIKRFSFGDLVLLQPELLDAYASAIILAARDQIEGLGSIKEEEVLTGHLPFLDIERIEDQQQEKQLLLATVEDLLKHEIAWREQEWDGPNLVFPSQTTRENSRFPDPEDEAVVFDFEGPIPSIYATLAVRLSHSTLFSKKEIWKNAVSYSATVGGTCGIHLGGDIENGQARLTLFFDKAASEQTRFHFEEYVRDHLDGRARPKSIVRRRITVCPKCKFLVTEQQVSFCRERGVDSMSCPVCVPDEQISLLDGIELVQTGKSRAAVEMDLSVDRRRNRETLGTLQGKVAIRDHDIMLCYKRSDREAIERLDGRLKEEGVLPWWDKFLEAGVTWQDALESNIQIIRSVAICIGRESLTDWLRKEALAAERESVKRGCKVIPVILSSVAKEFKLEGFLAQYNSVDLRTNADKLAEELAKDVLKLKTVDGREIVYIK